MTYTTRSSFETSPKSCWVFLRSKKLNVSPPFQKNENKRQQCGENDRSFRLLPWYFCETNIVARHPVGHLHLRARVLFETVLSKSSESPRPLSCPHRNLCSRVNSVYLLFVGRSQNRNPHIRHLEVTQDRGIECFEWLQHH